MAVATEVTRTGPPELADQIKDGGVRVLDVRSPAEFESAHIAGSFNLPLDRLPTHAGELGRGLEAPVVLVCRSGQRAREAERMLREADAREVQVLEGGLMAWEQAGLPVKRGRQRWSLERQVRAIAGTLVLIGTLGSLFVWPPLLFLAMFVGGGLLFAGVTDTCTMGMLLLRLPYNRGPAVDSSRVVAELTARPSRV